MALGLVYDSAVTIGKIAIAILEGGMKWIFPPKPKEVNLDVVLITGAASGMGRLLARKFAALGASVILWDINKNQVDETAEEIRRMGGTACSYHVDCRDREAVYKTADKVLGEVGRVDILVNNAGIISGKNFLDLTDDDIIKTMDINVMSHFWTIRKFLPQMLDRDRGHVVTISSAAGLLSGAGIADYAVSKHACFGLDLSLKYELSATGHGNINTTVICPYFVNTGMFDGVGDVRVPWLLPILNPEEVTDKMMSAILTNETMLIIPWTVKLIAVMQLLLPLKAMIAIADFMGVDRIMENFKGH